MRVGGKNTAVKVTPTEVPKPKNKAAETTQKRADAAQEIGKSAERLAKANSSRFRQIANPGSGAGAVDRDVLPDRSDLRAKAPEGTVPGGVNAEDVQQNTKVGGSIDGSIAGPQQGNSVDSALREEVRSGLFPDGDQMMARGKQIDGRDPEGAYRGSEGPIQGTGKEAAGAYSAETNIYVQKVQVKINEAAAGGRDDEAEFWADQVSDATGKTSPTGNPLAGWQSWPWEESEADWSKEANKLKKEAAAEAKEKQKTESEKLKEEAKKTEEASKTEEKKTEETEGSSEEKKADTETEKAPEPEVIFVDRLPENDAPDPHGLKDFTDKYQEMKIAAMKNSETNPGDQMDGGPVGEIGEPNTEQYTANYGEGHTAPSKDEIEAAKKRAKDAANPDEEF